MKNLFVVQYVGDTDGNAPTIEGITNDTELWLRQHNADRVGDGERPEYEDDFEFIEMSYEERTEENTDEYSLGICNCCHDNVPIDLLTTDEDGDDYCEDCK